MVTERRRRVEPPELPPPEEPPEIPEEEAPTLFTPEEVVKFPTTVTQDGWEFRDIAWNVQGEAINYIASAPTGEEFTKAELDVLETQALQPIPLGGGLAYNPFTDIVYEIATGQPVDIAELQAQETALVDVFSRVFPAVENPSEVLRRAGESEENLGELLELVRRIGRTEDTENFLKAIAPDATTEQIDEFFGVEVPTPFEEEMKLWETIELKEPEFALRGAIQSKELSQAEVDEFFSLKSTREAISAWIAKTIAPDLPGFVPAKPLVDLLYDIKTGVYPPPSAPPGKAEIWLKNNIIDPFVVGGIHIFQGLELSVTTLLPTIIAEAIKDKELSESIIKSSEEHFLKLYKRNEEFLNSMPSLVPKPEYEENPFENPELFTDPGYWAYNITNSLAYTLGVMSTIVTVTTATGGNILLGLGAGMVAAGAPEAPDMTKELLDRGVPFEEATKWGILYGAVAGGVESVSNIPFLSVLFKPAKQAMKPFWDTLFRGTASNLARAVVVGVVIPTIEGLEEAVTQATHNAIIKHYDEFQSLWEGVDVAFIRGLMAASPFGLFGGTASYISFRTALPSSIQTDLDSLVDRFKKAGATELEAQVMAVNEIAKTPEGEKAISEALEEAKKTIPEAPVTEAIALPTVPATNWQRALTEADQVMVKLETGQIRPDLTVGTKEYQDFIDSEITRIATKYGVPETILRKQTLWEPSPPRAEIRTPLTEAEIDELVAGITVKPPTVKPVVPEVGRAERERLAFLREDLARIERETEAGVIPRAVANKQISDLNFEIANLERQLEVIPKPPAVAPLVTPPVEEIVKPSGLTIETTKQDTFTKGASVSEDASRVTEDAINAQSDSANLPPPNIPPGTVGHIGSGGNNAENSLYDMTNRVIPGEDEGRAALRIWSGTRKRMATETISWWRKGNQLLKEKGIGKPDGVIQRLTKEDSYELFKALHGEADVPANLQDVYDELKKLLDQESSDMLAFDPSFSRVMMAHPDYFPRGWRPPTAEQAGRMRIGAKPGFLKPRVDATFTEMVEGGWEPISWNPYDMAALRRMAGTEYREGRILVSRLKTFSKAIAARDAPREGWRVPKVGPAFEGKPYVGTDGKAYMTPRIAIPNKLADVLESVYGVPVEFRVAGVDIFRALTAFGALTKRVKLFGSLFQHVDFLTRDFITAFTPEGIRHAQPLKFPSLAARVTASAVSPSYRATLEARILSGEPLYSDSTITLKMVADAGWELGQDELLIRREVRDQLDSIVREAQAEGLEVRWFQRPAQIVVEAVSPITRRLNAASKFFEAGLFDGVYRESQAWALEHVIIPRLRRLHPTWTDQQIAGSAAEEVNKQFSTLAVWQSVLQQPAAREFARAMFFSWNESESWIRQATSAVKGKNARYWREYAIATFIALAVAANVINLISERRFLPLDRYVPISLGNSYSSMPWGIAYNPKFLSPRLPWNGRNGQPIYLDIVGQADTYLRWMLDPIGALTARVNVLPRALMNQVNGEDFWGRELEDMDDRVKQAIIDLFAPIGAGNLLEAARLQWPPVAGFLPEAEGRIGITGSLIQVSGLNVRAEQTMDMLDRYARESGLLKADGTPVESWDDLEPHQKIEFAKNEDLQRELGLRGEAAVERQYPGAEGFAKLGELDQERITRGEALIAELIEDLAAPDVDRATSFDIARAFRNEVTRLKREIADRKAQVSEDFQLFQETGVLPEDPNDRALVEYYNIFEKAKKPSGVIDWDEVNRLEEELRDKWTPEQESYVDRNTGLTEWGSLMDEFIEAQKILSDAGYWDVDERDRKVFRFQHPGVEKILTGKFYNYKPIEEGAEKITLEWQDVYRQIDDMETGFKEQSDEEINALPPMEGVTTEDWLQMSANNKRDLLIDHERELIYAENPGFWEDNQRRDAWNKGFVEGDEDTEGFVDLYLERAIIVRATSPLSPETKLFLLDHPDFFKKGRDLGVWTDDGTDWNRPVLEISVQYATDDDWYSEGIPDRHAEVDYKNRAARDAGIAEERSRYLADNPEYNKARYRRDAYGLKDKNFNPFPDELVETYVDYYTNPDLKKPDDWEETSGTDEWYEDDWFLQENPEFHQALVDYGKFSTLRDFSKVPTREVFTLYQDYLGIEGSQERLNFRHANPELDDWLVDIKEYKPVGDRWTTTDPELANRKYWLELARHFKNMLKNLGIREDITPEELTNEEMEQIKKAIRQLYE